MTPPPAVPPISCAKIMPVPPAVPPNSLSKAHPLCSPDAARTWPSCDKTTPPCLAAVQMCLLKMVPTTNAAPAVANTSDRTCLQRTGPVPTAPPLNASFPSSMKRKTPASPPLLSKRDFASTRTRPSLLDTMCGKCRHTLPCHNPILVLLCFHDHRQFPFLPLAQLVMLSHHSHPLLWRNLFHVIKLPIEFWNG